MNEITKILIIDDDLTNLDIYENVLRKPGREILKATSGKDALQVLLKETVSLFLIDVQMPEMNGFDTAQIIKQREKFKDVPIIFISGIHKSEHFIKHGFIIGAYDYIVKPVDEWLLKNKVNIFLTLHEQKKQLQKQLELKIRTEKLVRSNKALEQFAYAASHDLRAPLEAIQKLVQWIVNDLERGDDKQIKTYLKLLKNRVQRMKLLLEALLQYSRIKHEGNEIEEIDTKSCINEVIDMLNPPPEFKIIFTTAMPVIKSVRPPLDQVFRNLIDNAIKHHHRQDGLVEIAAGQSEKFYKFTIKDDGPGIDPQFHDQIFEMFQTLKPKDEVEGSGMGLALVKKIIHTFGGEITVESEKGKGSTFSFTWPIEINNAT